MLSASLRIAVIAIAFAILGGHLLRADPPTQPASSPSEEDQTSDQEIQKAIVEIRESVTGLNQQVSQLEKLWQNDQESLTNAPTALHAEVWAMDSNGQNARRVAHVPGFPFINSPEISPDGKCVAVDGWKADENFRAARLLLIDIENGHVDDLGEGAMPNWSPDGNWIAYCKYFDERGVYVGSLDGKIERHIDLSGWGIQWSPDGWKVAYGRGGHFVVHNFVSGESREIIPDEWDYTQIYWNPTWSPDSKEICFKAVHQQGHNEFAIVNVESDTPTVRRRISADGFHEDIAWHPDGTRILIPKAPADGVPGQIYEYDPNKGNDPSPLIGQPTDRHNAGMCWSRDGKTLYFISRALAR